MAETHSSSTEAAHDEPNYVGVFIALAVLTAIEVGITYVPMPRALLVFILLALAFAKAAFVALYFMHLRFDSRLLTIVFVIPIVLGAFLIYFLMV